MKLLTPAIVGLLLCTAPASGAATAASPGVDENTIALWLFDDPPYGNVTLTDAGPLQIDLRLETGTKKPLPPGLVEGERGLAKGRFGSALRLPVGEGAGVSWPRGHWLSFGSLPLFARGDEVPGRCNVGDLDWTPEVWLRASGEHSIWQYGTVRFTEHGGALYGGVEHEGGYYDRLLRLVQRLDGFVSLDAGEEIGTVVTRPLVFEGARLVLNVAAEGSLRVGLLDEAGRGDGDVSRLAGGVVQLQVELQNTRLFALQFVPRGAGVRGFLDHFTAALSWIRGGAPYGPEPASPCFVRGPQWQEGGSVMPTEAALCWYP
jgi:hypothetical protein